jgi:phage gp36-like protein
MKFINEDDINKLIAEYISDDFSEQNSDIIIGCEKIALSTIQSYVGSKYDLETMFNQTLDNRDYKLIEVAVNITLYNLMGRYGRMNEYITKRYDDAIFFLRDVATSKISPSWIKFNGEMVSTGRNRYGSTSKMLNTDKI